jgi:filamentous hemagglutinin
LREVPLGFADAEEFRSFGAHLGRGLHTAGYRDVIPVFKGSSVTGVKFMTGELFDAGRTSDFDIALAGPSLFARAKALGVQIRGRGTRTAPLTEKQLEKLGLLELRNQLRERMSGRPVAFMVYRDLEQTLARGPSIPVR